MTVLLATGDLVVEEADAHGLFAPSAPLLASGDIVVGHLEIPHVADGTVLSTDVPALPGPPSALDAVAAAGFDVLTLAGNHVYDFGPAGIDETRAHCADRGIATAGTGQNIAEALRPAIIAHGDLEIAVISINCVGPRETWATTLKPGNAYIEVITHYEARNANPGGPPRIHTFADQPSLTRAADAVSAAAASGAIVIVALHKGLVHVPVDVAEYEREIAHALIDAGASAIIGHHAHILRGVEVYRGRPVFHGLGNFVTVTRALSASPGDAEERASWGRERVRLFGFVPDPAMPAYPFHPESRNTAVARMEITASGVVAAAALPLWIDDDARPVPVAGTERGRSVTGYIRQITASAGFHTIFDETEDGLSIRLEQTVV